MEEECKRSIWVVEVLQKTGRWEPVAAPRMRPFARKDALRRMEELIEEYPQLERKVLHATAFKMASPVRVRRYEATTDIRWKQEKEPNHMNDPIDR
jgi:hypothetical protein